MPGMQDLTMLLMQTLLNDPSGGGTRRPIQPEQAMGDTGGGEAAPQSAASRLASSLGVDESELTAPASGPQAEALGVAGVTPDYDKAEKLFKLMAAAKQMGMDEAGQGGAGDAFGQGVQGMGGGGGAPPENPALRKALAYQAMQQSVQNFGPGHLGGNIVSMFMPLMAPEMLGPLMEQQKAEAQQAVQRKNAMELAKTAAAGEERAAKIEKMVAETEYKRKQTLQLGKKKYRVSGSPKSGGWIIDQDTGDIVERISPVDSAQLNGAPKPVKHTEDNGDQYNYYWKDPAGMFDGSPPDRKDLIKVGGSAGEREKLAKLHSIAVDQYNRVRSLYKKGLTGPNIGAALEQRKTGGLIGQYIGEARVGAALSAEQEKEATKLKAALENYNTASMNFWSGLQLPDAEMERRRNQNALMTDLDEDFLPHLDESANFMNIMKADWEKRQGIRMDSGQAHEQRLPSEGFRGKPSTPPPGAGDANFEKFLQQEMP